MADGVGAGLAGDLDLLLGDQRPGDGGAEQVHALVERVGAEHREHVVADELLAQVLDEDVVRLDAEHLGLRARRLQLLALAEVGGEGDDLGLVGLLQPLQDDRGVEAARIGEHDLLHLALGALGGHCMPRFAGVRIAAHYRQVARPASARSAAARRATPGRGWPDACASTRSSSSGTSSPPPIPTSRPCASRRWRRRPAWPSSGSRSCWGRSSRRRAGTPRRSTSTPPRAATWCAIWSGWRPSAACASPCRRLFHRTLCPRRGWRWSAPTRAGSRRSREPSTWPSSATAPTSPTRGVLKSILAA